jgi:hypothetical protein
MMNIAHWVNLTDYTPFGLITFGLGCFGWLKFMSTGLCTFVCFERFIVAGKVTPGHHTALFFCVAFAVIDLAFIYMVTTDVNGKIAANK